MGTLKNLLTGGTLAVLLLVLGCGSDAVDTPAAGTEATTADQTTADQSTEPTQNACPVDGCRVSIEAAEPTDDELLLTFEANYLPDFSKNHIHVYWDIYTAAEVSSDAVANGLEQGVWVPTDSYPTYTTAEVVSTAERGGSSTLCVTTSDGDHNVIDKDAVHCVDVSQHL